jgi:hypothetical protein
VATVDGSGAAGTCGSGTTGTFTLTSGGTTFTAEVGPSTTYQEHGVARATFADVCVADKTRVVGTISADDVVTAASVAVTPPAPEHVSGPVATVDGSGAAGTCGSGTTGTFTLTSGGTTFTAEVGPSTVFKKDAEASPSFRFVCVGDRTRLVGPPSGSTSDVKATQVVVLPNS